MWPSFTDRAEIMCAIPGRHDDDQQAVFFAFVVRTSGSFVACPKNLWTNTHCERNNKQHKTYPPASYTTEISEKGDHFGWPISGKIIKLSAPAKIYEVWI